LLFLGSSWQRRLALSVLVAEALFLSFGFTNYFGPFWFGPPDGLYEMMLFRICVLYLLSRSYLPGYCGTSFAIVSRAWKFRSVPRSFDGAVAVVLPLSIGLYAMAIGPDVPEQSQRYAGFGTLRLRSAARNPITVS